MANRFLCFWAGGLLALLIAAPAAAASEGGTGIRLLPGRVVLDGPHASQRLVVERIAGGRAVGDITRRARFRSRDPAIARVDADGVVRPVADGRTTIAAQVGGQVATVRVIVRGARRAEAWSFRRHVLPVLSRMGCNSGACHGAAAGKGGMKLTLRGYDPVQDYFTLTREAWGRRVVPTAPERSLLLLKPSGAVPHGGGRRFRPDSLEYRVLREWIAAGMPRPSDRDPRLLRVEVLPSEVTLAPKQTQQLIVRAHYSDGRVEDVTRWAKYGSNDTGVASVDDEGLVRVEGPGEAPITVWFSSQVTFARVTVPFPTRIAAAAFARAERRNFVDEHVLAKLAALRIPPSRLCSDAEFLRRASLDATGTLPDPATTRAFLADPDPNKRDRLIEQLLASEAFVDYWTYRWSDLLLVSSRKLAQPAAMLAFSRWIRQSVAENKPWDRFAREILTATGSNLENGAANYYLIHKETIDLAETTTQAFLGMSVMCARCHNHPLEKWTQSDYYAYANLFARVALKNGDQRGEVFVYSQPGREIEHPRLGVALPPRPLDGPPLSLAWEGDRRVPLAKWLTAPENPYFARAIVNRVWRNFMGRGLVEPEDDLRLTNPASNEALMAALTRDFVQHGFDLKHLMRTIMRSATYQRSAEPVPGNESDLKYGSHYLARRLSAEVMLDALSQVTGVPTDFPGYPRGTRALQLPDSQVSSYFLTTFGRPPREQTCSCERQEDPSLIQALHLRNGATLNEKLRARDGRIDALLDRQASDAEVLSELFLAALCREPTEDERRRILPVLAATPADGDRAARRAACEDLFWAVLTSKEFLFNH